MILCYLAVRIYQFLDQKGFGTKSNLMKIGLLLIFNPIVNSIYYFGQTIVLCTLFLWLTYEYFQKDKMLLSGIFLAVAVLIKPTTLIVLPLLLPIEWNNNHLVIDFKKGIQLFLGLIFLVLVQGLFFVLNPDVFKAWISANEGISTNSLINSASLIPYMILIYPNSLIIELLLLGLSVIWIAYARFIKKINFTFCFIMVILSSFLFYLTSWFYYPLIVFPFLLVFIIITPKIKFSNVEMIGLFALCLIIALVAKPMILVTIILIGLYVYLIIKSLKTF